MDNVYSYDGDYDYDYDFVRMTPAFQAFSAVGIVSLIFLAIVGNVLTIVAYIRDSRLNTVYDFYIFNLAITDLLIGCISMPFYAVYTLTEFTWNFGNIFCKVWLVIDFTLCLESILLVLLLSLDRLLLISYGPYYTLKVTRKKACVQIVLSWMIAFVTYGPSIIGWNHWVGYSTVGHMDCDVEFAYNVEFTTITAVVEFALPVTCLAIFNSLIYYKIRNRIKINHMSSGATRINTETSGVNVSADKTKINNTNTAAAKTPTKITFDPSSINERDGMISNRKLEEFIQRKHGRKLTNSRAQRDSKAARFLAALVVVFLFCWAPYTITTMIVSVCADKCVNTSVYEVMNWLLWTKSAVNPFLYAINSSRYRYNFKKYLVCWKTKIFQSNTETTLHTAA